MFKGDFADTCAENSPWCRWGAERRVKLVQTRSEDPYWLQRNIPMLRLLIIISSISIYNLTFLTYSRLGSAYSMDGKDVQAAECFHQAEQIYMVVPGEGSCFYKKTLFGPCITTI